METNFAIFRQVELDSSRLTPLVALATVVARAGEYQGIIWRDSQEVGRFLLSVTTDDVISNVKIDLAGDFSGQPKYLLSRDGYLLAHVSWGERPYGITVKNLSTVVLDSGRLQEGQLAIFTMIRPGVHVVRDNVGGTCTVSVAYPSNEWDPSSDDSIPMVTLTKGEPSPKTIYREVAQAVSFIAADGSHFVSHLREIFERVDDEISSSISSGSKDSLT